MKVKITHLTSAHSRYDTRIFLKECVSLAKLKKYEVSLVVADNKDHETKNSINIYDVGKLEGRINRAFITTRKIFKKAKELDSDIYHFHDPELISVGLKLKKLGKKVIFDVHENTSLQIKDKEYLPKISRGLLSKVYRIYEKIYLKKFDYLILAEKSYQNYYENLSQKFEVVLNMPDIEPLVNVVNNKDKNELFYIGGISNNRGLDVTIEAIKILKDEFPDVFMHYVGSYDQKILDNLDLKSIENNVKFYGEMPLLDGLQYSRNAKIGLSILKPIENYTKSYSTKIFEYMALGMPVITSNFQLYKDVVERFNCGICINPLKSKELADAITYLFNNPKEARQMGENGAKVVSEKYNWKREEKKLLKIYQEILQGKEK
ncbi:MAG: glycosyltransferase involved in cell wall biosynthesis [Psychroserpens sp.]|jgi:glycosyltransferase involved in cell wall biosynthesis